MNPTTARPTRRLVAVAASLLLLTSACNAETTANASAETTAATDASTDSTATDTTNTTSSSSSLFDSSVVHDIVVEFDEEEYAAMLATFSSTGEKEWIEATITIDGVTYEQVGLRLKGNSSLFGLSADTADDPSTLPWLIQLDEYIDDQNHEGITDLVIRSNSTETAMNEAIALELLELAGLATQQAIAVSFTVNGTTELRLAIEHPDDIWEEAYFDAEDAALYKADSEGDYSYRGDDPEAYDDVFNQKAGEDDLEPLIEFLDFINNSDDETFAAELSEHLDVEAFAAYLAMQELVGNFDDIDGPGNNSYLHYDGETGQFTVVNWDLNLAFGTSNVNGGGPGGGGGGFGGQPGQQGGQPGQAPEGAEPPEGFEGGQPGQRPEGVGGFDTTGGPQGGGGPNGGSNILVERFMANSEFAALYAEATEQLTATLFDSGVADELIATWSEVLTSQASDLVSESTVQREAEAIRSWLAAN